jgi:hypothetical protein
MKLKVIDLGPQQKGRSPFAMYFVYSKNESFVVKGPCDAVQTWMNAYPHPCFYRYTFWGHGTNRGHWSGSKGIYIMPRPWTEICSVKKKGNYNFYISIHTKDGMKTDILKLRRMPHHWLPQLDEVGE